jgi:hypothetical protein
LIRKIGKKKPSDYSKPNRDSTLDDLCVTTILLDGLVGMKLTTHENPCPPCDSVPTSKQCQNVGKDGAKATNKNANDIESSQAAIDNQKNEKSFESRKEILPGLNFMTCIPI